MPTVLLIVSVFFGLVATIAGVMDADQLRVMLTVTSSGSVSEIMLPFGHWFLAAAWMAAVAMLLPGDRRDALYRCLGVALALHALILVTLFVDKLADREAFSARIYLIYARLFCMTALAAALIFVVDWARAIRHTSDRLRALDAPIAIGAAALAIALARQNMAIVAGAVGAASLFFQPSVRARAAQLIRATVINQTIFLAGVFVIALALRLLYVQRIMSDPGHLDTGADGRIYDQLAWQIAGGGGVPDSFTTRYPLLLLGYVWFLAAIYKVIGHSYFAAVAIQSILGAATAVLVYFAGARVFGAAVGRVAALFTALSFSLIFAAAALGHQAVDVFLTALIVLTLLRLAGDDDGAWKWAAVGVLMGLTIAVRETVVFFAAFVALWIAYAYPKGWRASMRAVAAYTAGAAIVLLPFAVPKVSTADARANLRAHFDRLYRGQAEAQPIRGELVGPLADPAAALSQFTSSPLHVVGTLARAYTKNFAVQFLTQPYGGFDLVFLRKGTEYYYGMWFYAYALAIAGTIAAARLALNGGASSAGAILILGLIASRTLPHIILESDYRHRVPIEPFLILLASVGAVSLWERISPRPAATSVV